MKKPLMNTPINLQGRASIITGKSKCIADLCWPEAKLILEHQGSFDHAGVRPYQEDRGRITALREMDYEVIEVTGLQVGDLFAFEAIALHIAEKLGKRLKRDELGVRPKRMSLREGLFAWNSRFGHPLQDLPVCKGEESRRARCGSRGRVRDRGLDCAPKLPASLLSEERSRRRLDGGIDG